MYADITFVNIFHAILYIIGRKEIKNMSVFKRREICSVSYTLSYKKDAGTNIKKLGARKQERRTNLRLDFVNSIYRQWYPILKHSKQYHEML